MEKNMAEELKPYWINLVDKIMMGRYNKSAPGFICIGKIPHTFGNERHIIYFHITSMLWRT